MQKLTMEKKLVGYMDAEWAGDVSDHRCTSGYIFSLSSVVVAWSSKKQSIVALSNTEIEYRATVATCEAIWLRRLLQDLRIEVPTSILIYYDNISSM